MTKFWAAILLGSIILFSECANQTYTTKELLEEEHNSRKNAVEIQSINEKVTAQVDLFNQVFSRYQKEEIASAVPELYAEEAFLNDRIHSVKGSRAIAKYFDGTFEKMHKSEFHIHDTTFAKHDVYTDRVSKFGFLFTKILNFESRSVYTASGSMALKGTNSKPRD